MKITKIFLFLLLSINLYAHKIPGILLEVKALENDKMLILGKFKKSKRILSGNTIRLISMFDNRVLYEAKQTNTGLITDIPKESYWIYLVVRDNDVVIDGIAPKNGFLKEIKKEPKAFLYTLISSLFLLFLSFIFMYRKKQTSPSKKY